MEYLTPASLYVNLGPISPPLSFRNNQSFFSAFCRRGDYPAFHRSVLLHDLVHLSGCFFDSLLDEFPHFHGRGHSLFHRRRSVFVVFANLLVTRRPSFLLTIVAAIPSLLAPGTGLKGFFLGRFLAACRAFSSVISLEPTSGTLAPETPTFVETGSSLESG